MADDELILDSTEPSTTDLVPDELVSDDEVTQDDREVVADEAETETPETISVEDFNAWKSKQDKRYSELEKQYESLKNQLPVVPDGPTPEEQRRFNDLNNQYQQLTQQFEQAETAEEQAQISYQLGSLGTSLIDAQATIIARKVGIDPGNADYLNAIRQETIENNRDLERIAYMVKANSMDSTKVSESVKEREKKVAKAEKSVEQMIQEGIASGIAGLRQELGLNATVAVQPGGAVGSRTQLQKERADAIKRGDWNAALQAEGILSQLIDD